MKLGIIGGLSPESTVEYYRILTGFYFDLKGEFPNLIIESIDVFKVLDLCEKGCFSELADYLVSAGEFLVKGGAEVCAMAANTPHIVFDEIQSRLSVPVISIVEATAGAINRSGIQKVGLLGTKFTMEQAYFRKPLEDAGLEVCVPSKEEIEYISNSITNELEKGVFKEDTRDNYLNIISGMQKRYKIEGVILGCTEIPLLMKDIKCPVYMFDTMSIHTTELLNYMLQ